MKLVKIYSTPLWISKLNENRFNSEELINYLYNLKSENLIKSKPKSNRNGWRSENNILDHDIFFHFKESILEKINCSLRDYWPNHEKYSLHFSAWANIHHEGGYNVVHNHPGSIVSGCVYLKSPQGSGRLFFDDPRTHMEMEFDMGNDAFKKDHSLSRGRVYIEPKPLMIVIFPSWLKHGVESADCEGRISIAFNISPMYVTTHTK